MHSSSIISLVALAIASESAYAAGWAVNLETTDEMSDERIVATALPSVNTWKGAFGREGRAELFVACRGNRTSVVVVAGASVKSNFSSGKTPIRHRFDKEPAISEEWSISTDSKSIIKPNPIPWIRALPAHGEIKVEISWLFPTDSSTWVARFELPPKGETARALEPIAKACHWEL